MATHGTIYALTDPRDGQIRYVGQTVAPLDDRLQGHLRDASRERTRKTCWLRKLLFLGLKPYVTVLARCPTKQLNDRERFWIRELRQLGARLTNETDGGEGVTFTPEIKNKISVSLVRCWKEGRHHLRGFHRSEENKSKISVSIRALYATGFHPRLGKKHSEETLVKLREGASERFVAYWSNPANREAARQRMLKRYAE